MSLTSCLTKAQGVIDPAIAQDLQDRSQTLEGRGLDGQGAARQAVQEAIALLTRQLRVATNQAQAARQSAPRDQTETPEFRAWFKDSKVTDANGKPLRVFHGSPSGEITQFDSSELMNESGAFFFTANEGYATGYADGEFRGTDDEVDPYVVQAFLSIQNPAIFDGDVGKDDVTIAEFFTRAGLKPEDAPPELQDLEAQSPWIWYTEHAAVFNRLRDLGFDGLSATEAGAPMYAAFYPEQIKSAIGNNGAFDGTSGDITQSTPRSTWYSGLQQAIEGVPDRLASMAAPQWKLWLDANAAKLGIKRDEIEWSGVKDFLDTKGKAKVTRDEIAGYLAVNGVKIEETVLGADVDWAVYDPMEREESYFASEEEARQYARDNNIPSVEVFPKKDRGNPTKYHTYTVPGGQNYREFLLTLPVKELDASQAPEPITVLPDHFAPIQNMQQPKAYQWGIIRIDDNSSARPLYGTWSSPEEAKAKALNTINAQNMHQWNEAERAKVGQGAYKSSHWDQKNVLAHLRVDDRTDADGARVLFINEVQSDWGADGRKKGFVGQVPTDAEVKAHFGLRDDADPADYRQEMMDTQKGQVPAGPFVSDTKAYVALALKRAIKLAVDEGYDKVAFVTGEQAADFFDLSKKVDSITYAPTKTGYYINVMAGGSNIKHGDFTPAELEDIVGKDIVQKMVNKEGKAEAEPGTIDYDALGNTRTMSGLDLKVGGEGMRGFYDSLVPNVTRDLLKKLGGGKMEEVTIQADKQGWSITPPSQTVSGKWMVKSSNYNSQGLQFDTEAEAQAALAERQEQSMQPGFTLTPAMKEKAAGGMVMFSAARDPQTETAAFKAWFGDWQNPKAFSSKAKGPVSFAVGKDKRPLTLYHATNADIRAFETGRETINSTTFGDDVTTRHGIFTSPDVKFSEEYLRKGEGQNVMPIYMAIKSPLDMREGLNGDDQSEILAHADGKIAARDFYHLQPTDHWQLFDGDFGANFVEAARKAGFDGAIMTEEAPEAGTNHDVYVAFDAGQIKSAIGNNGDFDGADGDITRSTIRDRIDQAINQPKLSIVGETSRQHTPEQLAAMRRVGFQVETPSLKDRAKALTQGLGKRLAQGVFDQFAPIRDLDQHAYLLTRLSKGASGAFESFLHGGKLKLSDGVYDFDEQAKGGVIDKLLTPLGGEHHDFFRWIAANRAERLTAEGKENLFSAEDIAALKTLTDGQTTFDYTLQHGPRAGQTTRSRAEAYADSLKTFNAFSDNVMDMAEQSGLIDGDARQFWEQEFYVPFYRVADEVDGGISGMGSKGSMVRQQAFKKLKGGKNMLNADLLDNTLMNWAHLLDASAKNRAAKATLEAAVNLGVALESNEATVKQMGKSAKTTPVWFMDSGKQRHFIVEDPMLLTALNSLEYAGMRNPVMNAMSMFKHVLTVGVTASPFFKIRNLIRDSVQIIGVAPIGANPLANIKQGWKLTDPKSDAYFRLLAGGGTIHFGTMLEGSEAKRVQKLVESGVDRATILTDESAVKAFYRRVVEPTITAYNELGNRGEGVNRAALYDQLVKQGVSHAEASLMARDTMDFSMAGSFTSIRFLTQILPFFNARLQGLFKLGKAAHEDPKRMAIVTGAVAVTAVSLLAAYGDDDDWKKREDWDRNGFFWFKVGGIAYRIPKPFELGAVATLAERGFEFMFDKEMTGKRLRSQVLALLSDNLAMNPVPQAFKPILDIYANKDAFSGRPIETPSMEKLRPEYRFTDRTSMVARGTSTALNSVTGLIGQDSLSPVQIDQMLRGYFGWLGAFVVGSADVLARPLTEQPAQAKSDLWKVATGNIMSDLRDAPSRYVSQMYEQSKELEQAYGTHRMLLKAGKTEEAAEFKEDNAEKLGRYKSVENVKQMAAKLNTRRREIERSDLDAVEKREALRRISVEQDKIARLIK